MSILGGALSYNKRTNDFLVNTTGTNDGWTPLQLSLGAEGLSPEDLETWAQRLGGQNQNQLFVDQGNPLATDSKENRGNSRLRPFKTLQRALLEVARTSIKKGGNNDLYERVSINVSPGDYEIFNGPSGSLLEFNNYGRYLDASRLIGLNIEWIVQEAFNTVAQPQQTDLFKGDLGYFVTALVNDLQTGGNYHSILAAKSLLSKELFFPEDPEYFLGEYTDLSYRLEMTSAILVLVTKAITAIRNLAPVADPSVEPDNNSPVCSDVADSIHSLLGIIRSSITCEFDPRLPELIVHGKALSESFSVGEPTRAQLQSFNSTVHAGVILPRGVSIIGEDLRKVIFRPSYVPAPGDPLAMRGAIFRMTGGNFFSGFTIKDGLNKEFSHHKLSAFEFCSDADLNVYYNKVRASFSDPSIYDRAADAANLLERNYRWLQSRSVPGVIPAGKINYTRVFESEAINFLVSIVKDLRELDSQYSKQFGEQFYKAHIIPLNTLQRAEAKAYYEELLTDLLQYVILAVTNQAYLEEEGFQDRTITGSTSETIILNGIEYTGRCADILGALSTLTNLVISRLDGTSDSAEVADLLQDEDAESRFQETSIVLGLDPVSPPPIQSVSSSLINTVFGSSPYIFSASLRSAWGLCGVDGDGSKVSGLKSYLAAQFTIVSLQKDANSYTTDDSVGEVSKRYRGSRETDPLDRRHFGYKVSNGAYAQLVSCFCIGPALHYVAESGAELSITNSTSNFGDISLYARGYVDNGAGGGAYPQDRGHEIIGIKKPANISDVPRRLNIGYLADNGTTLNPGSNPQTGTIALTGLASTYGYDLVDPQWPTRIRASIDGSEEDDSIAEIISITTAPGGAYTILNVKFITDFDTTWNTDQNSPNYTYGLIGRALFFQRLVDDRLQEDKLYKLLLQKAPSAPGAPKREPVVNYILRQQNKTATTQAFKGEWREGLGGSLYYLSKIQKATDLGPLPPQIDAHSVYECLFVQGYSNEDGQIQYLEDLLESVAESSALNRDPRFNPSITTANHSNRSNTLDIMALLEVSNMVVNNSDLDLSDDRLIFLPGAGTGQALVEFNKPSIIRCSGQTWEYVGYLNYDTALPQLQPQKLGEGLSASAAGRLRFSKIQTQLYSGRVYATGMDEDGNQYVGSRVLDLKTGEEIVVSRGDVPFFEQQLISTFENLKVSGIKADSIDTRNLIASGDINTETLGINEDSIVLNADSTNAGNDWKFILTRNNTQQERQVELFLPADVGLKSQALTTDGEGRLRWAYSYATAMVSSLSPNFRPDGSDLLPGDLWWESSSGALYIYYSDQLSTQWVEVGGGNSTSSFSGSGNGVILSATAPDLRPDGGSLEDGDLWWNISNNQKFTWVSDVWVGQSIPAGNITGELLSNQIPGLDASKITSGIISPSRLNYNDLELTGAGTSLPSGVSIGGRQVIVSESKPTTRVGGAPLQAGDRWWKSSDCSSWCWNGNYWLSANKFTSSTRGEASRYSLDGVLTSEVIKANAGGVYLHSMDILYNVLATNDGANYWSVSAQRHRLGNPNVTLSGVGFNTSLDSVALDETRYLKVSMTLNQYLASNDLLLYSILLEKTGTPGSAQLQSILTYSLVA